MANSYLAVDYGTSNTVAVVRWEDGRVRPLLFDGSPLLPSAVWLADDGRLLTGHDAMRAARFNPVRYEPNPKRRVDEPEVLLGDSALPVERLVAATLGRVADEARRTLGAMPSRVALTHPVVWGPARRNVLVEAARSVGFTGVTLVPEPVAGATYLASMPGRQLAEGGSVLIYDLGAGTFDASVVRRESGQFTTLAYRGLEDVGGLDFDAVIVAHVGKGLSPADRERWEQILAPADLESRRRNRMLWEDAKAAKELLSRESSTGIHLPGLETDTVVTRAEFEAGAAPLVARTVEVTLATLRESRVRADQLSALFLVGGGSRIPVVATELHRALGVAPTVLEQPEMVVSEGGLKAIQGPPAPVPQPPAQPQQQPLAHGQHHQGYPLHQPIPQPAWLVATPPQPATAPPWQPGTPYPPHYSAPGHPVPVSGAPVSAAPVSAAPGAAAPVSPPAAGRAPVALPHSAAATGASAPGRRKVAHPAAAVIVSLLTVVLFIIVIVAANSS